MEVSFEGKSYSFPDDASPEEISAILNEQHPVGQPSQSPQPSPTEVTPPQDQGILASIKDAFTGEQRQTPETLSMPDWMQMPDLGLGGGMAAFKTVLGSTFAGPDEIAQIIKSNLPSVGVRQDAKGNYLFKSAVDGQEYALAPGFTASDLGRAAVGLPLMALPVGKTIPTAAGISAATQAGIEVSQDLAGGSIDPGAIATAGVLGGVLRGASNILPAVTKGAKSLLPGVDNTAQALAKAPDQALMTNLGTTIAADAPNTISIGAKSPTELAAVAKSAAKGSDQSMKTLAEQAAPDAQLAKDASSLGLDNLSPEALSSSQAFKDIAEAAKTVPGAITKNNKADDILAVSNAADETLRNIGATGDLSKLNSSVKDSLLGNIADLKNQASQAFNKLGKEIPKEAPSSAPNTLALLEERIKELGGRQNLSPLEKRVMARLTPKPSSQNKSALVMADGTPMSSSGQQLPTYGLFDDTKKMVGAFAAKPGISKTAKARADNIYAAMTQDLEGIVTPYGKLEDLKLANAIAKRGFDLEKETKELLGRKLSVPIASTMKKAVQGLASTGDTESLIKTMKAIPEQFRGEAAANGLRLSLGKFKEDGSLNLGSFNQFWGSLRNNEKSFNALASYLPKGSVEKFDSLARLSRAVSTPAKGESSELIKQRIMSATTLSEKLGEVTNRYALRVRAQKVAGFFGMNVFGASALTRELTPLATRNLQQLDTLLASPGFIATVKKIGTPEEQIAVKKFIMSKPFKSFKKALGNPAELNDSEKFIIQSIQAAARQNKGSKL